MQEIKLARGVTFTKEMRRGILQHIPTLPPALRPAFHSFHSVFCFKLCDSINNTTPEYLFHNYVDNSFVPSANMKRFDSLLDIKSHF